MSNSLLAAALIAVTNNTVITYDDYVTKKLGDYTQYDALDQKSLHQSHLVGGEVPTSVTNSVPKKYIKFRSFRKDNNDGVIYVKMLTGKTITLEFKPSD